MEGAAVRITTAPSERYRLTFRFADGTEVCTTSKETKDRISHFRRQYVQELYNARLVLGTADPICNRQAAALFFARVHGVGLELLSMIAEGQTPQLANAFERTLRGRSGADPARSMPSLVEIDAPDLFLPIEIFPLLGIQQPEVAFHPTDLELAAIASSFVGMWAIVRRQLTDGEIDQNTSLTAAPRLPVKYFRHADLPGALKDKIFFDSHADRLDIDGPWPTDEARPTARARVRESFKTALRGIGFGWTPAVQTAEEAEHWREKQHFVREMTHHLMVPETRFDGRECKPPSQIVHFSCHCRPAASAKGDYELELKGTNGTKRCVRIGEIRQALATGAYSAPSGGRSRPFVFLSACASWVNEPDDFASFEALFASTQHRGVIATQTSVPDLFASELTEIFYTELLKQKSVGHALHIARWEMLRLRQNPLGLLYNLYGNPDLRVDRSPQKSNEQQTPIARLSALRAVLK
jgi:hypothetical protein